MMAASTPINGRSRREERKAREGRICMGVLFVRRLTKGEAAARPGPRTPTDIIFANNALPPRSWTAITVLVAPHFNMWGQHRETRTAAWSTQGISPHQPKRFHCGFGWEGTSYAEALDLCSNQSTALCPPPLGILSRREGWRLL
mmetsp:Transcript_33263/g.70885  ORF Transcript_33263/g.70885 Transcript_33263/m.70885 type:complete len:144 (-) Transcript_33263:69-500(-)